MATRPLYATAQYAAALVGRGEERAIDVPEWQTFLIARPIDRENEDASGPYPRTQLSPKADIQGGIERLRNAGFVSVVIVPDPFFGPTADRLESDFSPCRPFKTHQIIDRSRGPYAPNKHHRYEIRRGFSNCAVERIRLADRLTDWTALYSELTRRHSITGPASFSIDYFKALADVPSIVTFAAVSNGRTVAMGIWFEFNGVAYNHLGASNSEGYGLGASYAVYDAAISHFGHAAVIDLGAGAGVADDPEDGLSRFKRGFANGRATALLCGVILAPQRYYRLMPERPASFFPAYRA